MALLDTDLGQDEKTVITDLADALGRVLNGSVRRRRTPAGIVLGRKGGNGLRAELLDLLGRILTAADTDARAFAYRQFHLMGLAAQVDCVRLLGRLRGVPDGSADRDPNGTAVCRKILLTLLERETGVAAAAELAFMLTKFDPSTEEREAVGQCLLRRVSGARMVKDARRLSDAMWWACPESQYPEVRRQMLRVLTWVTDAEPRWKASALSLLTFTSFKSGVRPPSIGFRPPSAAILSSRRGSRRCSRCPPRTDEGQCQTMAWHVLGST